MYAEKVDFSHRKPIKNYFTATIKKLRKRDVFVLSMPNQCQFECLPLKYRIKNSQNFQMPRPMDFDVEVCFVKNTSKLHDPKKIVE